MNTKTQTKASELVATAIDGLDAIDAIEFLTELVTVAATRCSDKASALLDQRIAEGWSVSDALAAHNARQ